MIFSPLQQYIFLFSHSFFSFIFDICPFRIYFTPSNQIFPFSSFFLLYHFFLFLLPFEILPFISPLFPFPFRPLRIFLPVAISRCFHFVFSNKYTAVYKVLDQKDINEDICFNIVIFLKFEDFPASPQCHR
jgi:hypothetical protein